MSRFEEEKSCVSQSAGARVTEFIWQTFPFKFKSIFGREVECLAVAAEEWEARGKFEIQFMILMQFGIIIGKGGSGNALSVLRRVEAFQF